MQPSSRRAGDRCRSVVQMLPVLLLGFGAVALVPLPQATAEDAAVGAKGKAIIPSAESLIGKTLDADRVYALSLHATRPRSGDWTYGFGGDAEGGLTLSAEVLGVRGSKSSLEAAANYGARCPPSPTVELILDDADSKFDPDHAERRPLTASWVYFGDRGVFDAQPLRRKMVFQAIDATFVFELDLATLSKRGQVALCPASMAADKVATNCTVFSLRGFSRAFEYVCNAK
jgi:hypothetical protein